MKTCASCRLQKPLGSFNFNGARADGVQSSCRTCDNAASREYYQKNRARHVKVVTARKLAQIDKNRQTVIDHLSTHPCTDCGITDLRVLEYDHVLDNKVDRISQMVATPVSTKTLLAEIAKCEVRCANCHRIRTMESLGLWRTLPRWAKGKPTPC